MATVVSRYFLLASNGQNPLSCTVDSNTQVYAEILIQSDYHGTEGENLTMLEATIVPHNSNTCIKKFQWTGHCLLAYNDTYTIDTTPFVLAAGSYDIQIGSSNEGYSNSGTPCNFTLGSVSC